MPYFTTDHIRIALDYLAESAHPSLVSFLAMTKSGTPVQAPGVSGIEFGSAQENEVLKSYFAPPWATPDLPYYVPFGPKKEGGTRWRPPTHGGTTLQRMRSDKDFVYAREGKGGSARWWLATDYLKALKSRQTEVIGTRPISVHNLAVWCYRDTDLPDHAAAIDRFRKEFQLDHYSLVPDVFSVQVDPTLGAIPMSPTPAGDAVQALIDPIPTGPTGAAAAAAASDTDATTSPPASSGSWDMSPAQLLEHTGHLQGIDEAIAQAVAALRSGMHVVFTGPPGCGKTELAQRLCAAGGFRPWQVTATDQWGPFETMGGYFPDPDSGGQVLDYMPGTVVAAIQQDRILIIDEVNRADIDKAFGELFTLLSGHPVDLMYQKRDGKDRRRIRLAFGTPAPEEGVEIITVPKRWRIIASMNDADKASLKRLSYAFVRRFAFVPVPVPPPPVYRALIDGTASSSKLGASHPDMVKAVRTLFAEPEGLASIGMTMGFAIPKAMLKHAVAEAGLLGRSADDILRSALELYLAPQFQGRADKHQPLLALLKPIVSEASLNRLAETLTTWTGFRSR